MIKLFCINTEITEVYYNNIHENQVYWASEIDIKYQYIRIWNKITTDAHSYVGVYNRNNFIKFSEYRDKRINEILE